MSPVTRPGIDPGTFRLVVQRLNHYATPGPHEYIETLIICDLVKYVSVVYEKEYLFCPQ